MVKFRMDSSHMFKGCLFVLVWFSVCEQFSQKRLVLSSPHILRPSVSLSLSLCLSVSLSVSPPLTERYGLRETCLVPLMWNLTKSWTCSSRFSLSTYPVRHQWLIRCLQNTFIYNHLDKKRGTLRKDGEIVHRIQILSKTMIEILQYFAVIIALTVSSAARASCTGERHGGGGREGGRGGGAGVSEGVGNRVQFSGVYQTVCENQVSVSPSCYFFAGKKRCIGSGICFVILELPNQCLNYSQIVFTFGF